MSKDHKNKDKKNKGHKKAKKGKKSKKVEASVESSNTVDIFVYGTLRPGQYNDTRTGLAALATGGILKNCTTKGAMYNRMGESPVYPVVDTDMDGVIIGDLLMGIDPMSREVEMTHNMEIGAGYEPRTVTIVKPDGLLTEALIYNYTIGQPFRSPHGVAIPSGDWIAFVNEDARIDNEGVSVE